MKREPAPSAVYTLEVGGRPTLCFPASSLNQAKEMRKEQWLRDELLAFKSDGLPLWDGEALIAVRRATEEEAAQYLTAFQSAVRSGGQEHDDESFVAYLVDRLDRG